MKPYYDSVTARAVIHVVGGRNLDRDFEMFFKTNERRIHYQIDRLGITGDIYSDFYTGGVVAL